MSDYMFMLENHLNSSQSAVLAKVQEAAQEANVNLFLTGGAIRDMLGGFPIRDLDFLIEGNAVKIAKGIAHAYPDIEILHVDENRKSVKMRFPGNVSVEIGMARQERYLKPGAKPQVVPATIHEDLRRRDFTINAIALSLNRASRGLLLDPTNGVSDLERKEIRATGNYTLYDSPIRLLRLIRFKIRLGFQIAERTQSQYANAREAEVEKHISPRALAEELEQISREPHAAELLQALEEEKLLHLISPALTGSKLNIAGFAKLQKARQMLPYGVDLPVDETSLFLNLLTEKLTPKERASLVETAGVNPAALEEAHKLETRARKFEKEVSASNLQRPSRIYSILSKAPGEVILFLLVRSQQRNVHDRVRNYLQKYLHVAQEVTDAEVLATGAKPGTPKFEKVRADLIAKHLDARPKKPPEELVTETSTSASESHSAR
jgi:tRNA nucleotidyltransferase/poly(A) polymerase